MTAFRRISLGVAALLMLAIIVGLGYVYFVDQTFLVNAAKRCTDLMFNYPFSWVVLLLIVIVLVNCLLSVLAVMLGIAPTYVRHLMIEGESGRIAVALDAVEEYLQRKGSMVTGVKDLQIHSEVSAGSLIVHSRLVLILEKDIPTFSREFQGLLRREITATLGFQNIQEIRVIIHKMVSDGTAAQPATAAEEEKPEAEPAEEEPKALGYEEEGESQTEEESTFPEQEEERTESGYESETQPGFEEESEKSSEDQSFPFSQQSEEEETERER